MITEEVVAFNHINYVRVEPVKQKPNTEETKSASAHHRTPTNASQIEYNWYSVYCMDVGGIVSAKFT